MYYNPVEVIETDVWYSACTLAVEKNSINKPLVVTSAGNRSRLKLDSKFMEFSIFSDIAPNPTFESCQAAVDFVKNIDYDGVVAIGGGSVLDTAKVILAARNSDVYEIKALITNNFNFDMITSSVFIPTTHGTGSEVTMWGTVWDLKNKRKYSISHPDLFPITAILDGNLTMSLPLDLSLISVLDALSHSFEAIWNKNANSKSTEYAIEAICLILNNVAGLKADQRSLIVRKNLLKAANLAGLAFSNTKTAAAHSISYPLTINYGIPHGIACSLPLLALLNINRIAIESELNLLIRKLELPEVSRLFDCIKQIPENILKFNLKNWNVKISDLMHVAEHSFTKGRMDNNIIPLTKDDVKNILVEILN